MQSEFQIPGCVSNTQIIEVYQSGLSYVETAKKLGVSRKRVERLIFSRGISRGRAPFATPKQVSIVINAGRSGYGGKIAARRSGLSVSAAYSILKKNGFNPITHGRNSHRHWGSSDSSAMGKHEREYEAAIFEFYESLKPKPPKHEGPSSALIFYYANHAANKAKCAERAKRRYYEIRHTPEYKAKQFARNQLARIARQARCNQKSKRTHEYLGASYSEAAAYITKQLPTGWTWGNYGKVWEIDHIVQLSDGLLTDPAHMFRICHYTNLRPMAVNANRTRQRGVWAFKQAA